MGIGRWVREVFGDVESEREEGREQKVGTGRLVSIRVISLFMCVL